MLRWLALVLLLANGLYWAAGRPQLARALGLPSVEDSREPGRWARQVRPEAVRVVTGPAATRPPSCLITPPLDEPTYAAALQDLRDNTVADAGWVDIRRGQPGRWAVLMGPFTDPAQMQRKQDELQRRRLAVQVLGQHPSLSPSLVLSEFASEADARRKLDELQNRGVRTARVELLAEATLQHQVRAEGLQAEQAKRLLGSASGVPWQVCSD